MLTPYSAAKMNPRYNFSESLQELQSSVTASSRRSTEASLFRSIPPERIGLQGEYDYNGLAKRVRLAIQQHFDESTTQFVNVLQRGGVVVLEGKQSKVAHAHLLQMAGIAMTVEGAVGVEVNGNTVFPPYSSQLVCALPLACA